MARRAAASGGQAGPAESTFAVAERTIIGLYDGGVLSPAVLERVIAGFARSGIDWHASLRRRAVDGRSLHEVVASTMMPTHSGRGASKDFLSVIEHLSDADVPSSLHTDVDTGDNEPDDDLLDQLAGAAAPRKSAASTTTRSTQRKPQRQGSASFNPLSHATAPGRKRDT
jgi:hypothetical protein